MGMDISSVIFDTTLMEKYLLKLNVKTQLSWM